MAQASNAGYTGYRYLVDATSASQYAIHYDDGKPVKPIFVFDGGGKSSFKPNQTVFAFDDEVETLPAGSGKTKVSTVAYQIVVDAAGQPRSLKQVGVDFDVSYGVDATGPTVNYKMTAESAVRLLQSGFAKTFPTEFSGLVGGGDFDTRTTAGGIVVPDKKLSLAPSFPPHQPDGAKDARTLVAQEVPEAVPAPQKKAAPSPFAKADAQTLTETKDLGGGEKLKIIFDFEARRVTEVYNAPGKQPALTGHSFAEHDADALQKAFNKLTELEGTPKPLEDKKPKLPGVGGSNYPSIH